MGLNQHRRMCEPAYHLEWRFDGLNLYRRSTETSCRILRCSNWWFLYCMYDTILHTGSLVENYLKVETVRHVKQPTCSDDVNPIKHFWDTFGWRTATRLKPPFILEDLKMIILEELNSTSWKLIDNVIESVKNRYKAVLFIKKDYMPY